MSQTPDEIAAQIAREFFGRDMAPEGGIRSLIAAAIAAERETHPSFPENWNSLSPAVQKAMAVFWHKLAIREREARETAEAERDAMSTVMGRMFGARFLDPPDGRDVPLPEQVRRLCEALQKAEAEIEKLIDGVKWVNAELRAAALREAAEVGAASAQRHRDAADQCYLDGSRPVAARLALYAAEQISVVSEAIIALIPKERTP